MEPLSGHLLIAGTSLLDPNFRRAVAVLIGHHDDEGAVGVVLNRASEVEVAVAVPPLAGLVEPGDRLFIGGPVSSQSAVVVADFEHPEAAEVVAFDSVGFLPEEADAESIGGLRRARVFAGYAGWGAGQLEAELDEGSWMHRTRPRDRRVHRRPRRALGRRAPPQGSRVPADVDDAVRPRSQLAARLAHHHGEGSPMASETFTFYVQPWYRKSPYFEATKRHGCKSWGL